MACTPHDLDCRLDQIIAALQTSPDGWDIAAVIIAAIGVLASSALAYAAWRASTRAVKIADDANDREVKRDEESARQHVDGWLAEFLVAAADYRVQLEAWAPFAGGGSRLADGPVPPQPNASRMLSALEAARLVASGEDEETLGLVAQYAQLIPGLAVANAQSATMRLAGEVRDWRNGSSDRGSLLTWIRGKPFIRG